MINIVTEICFTTDFKPGEESHVFFSAIVESNPIWEYAIHSLQWIRAAVHSSETQARTNECVMCKPSANMCNIQSNTFIQLYTRPYYSLVCLKT